MIFFFFFFFFLFIYFFVVFFVIIITVQFANSTLLSLLSFSYFITPYDAQASSAFSALIFTSDEYDLYFFTVANRGGFDN